MRRSRIGLTIGTFTTGLLYNQIVKLDGVKFDLEKMSWIGKASSEPRVMTLGTQVPIKTYKELMENKQTLNFRFPVSAARPMSRR